MKRCISVLWCAVMMLSLAACADDSPGAAISPSPTPGGGALTPSEYTDSDFDTSGDIVMATEYEIYGSDAPEVSYTIKNNTAAEFTYGVPYAVEVYRDGIWYHVAFPDNTAWITIGIILKANDTNSHSFKFSALDYTMTDGQYRLIKKIGDKWYSTEFQIGKSPITAETPFGYQALEKLPKDYDSEAAAANGDIVITNNDIINDEKLAEFIRKVSADMPAMARIVQYTDEGDPIITDYIFNAEHRGNYVLKHDNSRDKFGSGVGITYKVYSYLITDGTYIYLSNCADWDLKQTYTNADMVQIPWAANLDDISEMTVLIKKMTKERLEWNVTRYKVYSPDGKQNVALFGDALSYSFESLTSGETLQVSDPDKIATKITDVFWLDEDSFVLVCQTSGSLTYFQVVGSTEYKSGYGRGFTISDGLFKITE